MASPAAWSPRSNAALTSAETRRCAPSLRLLARRGRILTSRPAILSAAARARLRSTMSLYTLWPDAAQPMICADVAYPAGAEWLRGTVVPTLRRLPDAAGWLAVRAGGALLAGRPGLAARVAPEAVEIGGIPRVVMVSPSGQKVSKAIAFVFAEGDAEPRAVVKAMADPRFGPRLRRETELLDELRRRTSSVPTVADALPPPPTLAAELDGEFVAVERLDGLALLTGNSERAPALAWLHSFQDATHTRDEPWSEAEASELAAAVADAWRLAGAPSPAAVSGRVSGLLAELVGTSVARCAVHGDFWRGNIAAEGHRLRIADWEWGATDGIPLFDIWTYELAELRWRAAKGERDLERPLHAALGRVREEVVTRGLDVRWALATLAPVLAELSFRIRKRVGMPDGMERPSTEVLRAVDRILLG
jgi:hypothetical protein